MVCFIDTTPSGTDGVIFGVVWFALFRVKKICVRALDNHISNEITFALAKYSTIVYAHQSITTKKTDIDP